MYDVLIIGCGPAGLSAAVYASRAQLKTAVFGDYKKGNLYKAHSIANYLGFPDDISGPDLCERGIKQSVKYGTEHFPAEIVDIQAAADGTFIIKDDQQKTWTGKTVIIATGQSFALSGIKNEQELTGKGISYCANCDGFFFRNKKIAVIGNGNFAGEEALQLLNYSKDITILSHGKDFTIAPAIEEELKKSGIKMQRTERIKEITSASPGLADGAPIPSAAGPATSLGPVSAAPTLALSKAEKAITNSGEELAFEGFFMAIGSAGATAFAKKLGLETQGSYIKINDKGETNLKGIYAAGDCTGSPPQVASSVGNGCIAALSAIKFIRGLNIYIQYN